MPSLLLFISNDTTMKYFPMIFALSILFVQPKHSELIVGFSKYFGGRSGSIYYDPSWLRVKLVSPCQDVTKLNKKISVICVLSGSCVLLHDNFKYEGKGEVVTYSRNLLLDDFNEEVVSMSPCHTRQVHLPCPQGTFVQAFHDDTEHNKGLSLECVTPSQVQIKVISTHGYKIIDGRQECPTALRGFEFRTNSSTSALKNFKSVCASVSQSDTSSHCGQGQALCGLNASIEANIIKSINPICCEVPNPGSTCHPSDELNPLFICNNLNQTKPKKCTYVKTTGIFITNTTTEIESKEITFYKQFGFTIKSSGVFLKNNFQDVLGNSSMTQIDWSQESRKSWSEGTREFVQIEIEGGSLARLYQPVGICSFFKVYSSKIYRQDYQEPTSTIATTTTVRLTSTEPQRETTTNQEYHQENSAEQYENSFKNYPTTMTFTYDNVAAHKFGKREREPEQDPQHGIIIALIGIILAAVVTLVYFTNKVRMSRSTSRQKLAEEEKQLQFLNPVFKLDANDVDPIVEINFDDDNPAVQLVN